tara:strand:+ start:510905 stop:511702 length:798 start_codon:yes stop_codon:yes gene_type:complete
MKLKLIVLIVLVITVKVTAQDGAEKKYYGTISTDRPDQTEASNLVPMGFLQVETGAFYETLDVNSLKSKAITFNTTLLRYGLLNNLELRLGFDFTEITHEFNGTELNGKLSGFSPLLLGVKIGVTEENGWLPEIAFIGHINVPAFASNDFKTKSTSTDFRFSLAHTLSEKSSLGYNIGMVWDGNITTANYIYTLAYGHSISDKIGAYFELYGDLPEGSSFNHLWNAGLTYLISNNIQLDISGGTGITQNVQDLFLSTGISFRIPE